MTFLLPPVQLSRQPQCRPAEFAAQTPAKFVRANVSGLSGSSALASYKKAIKVMLALPPNDPRSWYRQVLVHTVDCPHGNWWFLPWHRGYLGWFERICRELSGDSTFALPYWDWSKEPRIPEVMFDDLLTPTNPAFVKTYAEFERLKEAVESTDYWTRTNLSNGVFDQRTRYGQLLARALRFPDDLWFDIIKDPRSKLYFEVNHGTKSHKRAPRL